MSSHAAAILNVLHETHAQHIYSENLHTSWILHWDGGIKNSAENVCFLSESSTRMIGLLIKARTRSRTSEGSGCHGVVYTSRLASTQAYWKSSAHHRKHTRNWTLIRSKEYRILYSSRYGKLLYPLAYKKHVKTVTNFIIRLLTIIG